jgi:hypothetical protein
MLETSNAVPRRRFLAGWGWRYEGRPCSQLTGTYWLGRYKLCNADPEGLVVSQDSHQNAFGIVCGFMPGLRLFKRYKPSWLRSDLGAGLSVAAIALPVGVAYADLAGVPPVIGIYSAIFPLLVYALFGSSRQLMTGPDAATCIIVAASLAPLAGGDPQRYLGLTVVLTLMTGILYVIAGLSRLGFIANFLSQPILTGYLNGIALIIIVGQFQKLLGYPGEAEARVGYRFDTINTAIRAFENRVNENASGHVMHGETD